MKYDLSNESQKLQSETYFNKLKNKGAFTEIKEIKGSKTNQQNRYLHLILSWFSIEYGESLDYVKLEFYKKKVNLLDFKTEHVNKKNGEIRTDWKSIKDFNSAETTIHIERFRNYSSENGIYLPAPDEREFLKQIESDIERYKIYL